MRLPVFTKRQAILEDAREVQERLYAAYLLGEKVFIPVRPDQDLLKAMMRAESNYHQFWSRRGWSLRCALRPERDGFSLWLQPPQAQQRIAS